MIKSFSKGLVAVSTTAFMLFGGAAIAADVPSVDSLDSEQLRRTVQQQDQSRIRDEERVRERVTASDDPVQGERHRKGAQSMERNQAQKQHKVQSRQRVIDAGSRGAGVGDAGRGRRGGGRR
jgi:hypothetical protein